jgi:hypothetical protein
MPLRGHHLLSLVLISATAKAESVSATNTRVSDGATYHRSLNRYEHPHSVVEFDLGLLALPDAEVCIRREAGCTRGDASLMISAWPQYRASERFSIGAGLTLALTPNSNTPRNDSVDVPRTHSRTYFMADLTGRYFPIVSDGFQAWLGLTTGLVVVSDSFTIANNQPEQRVVGRNGSNVATEGLSLGIAAGGAWSLNRNLTLGGNLRLANWFLPTEPEHTVLNDVASLSGRVTTVILAVSLGYQGG